MQHQNIHIDRPVPINGAQLLMKLISRAGPKLDVLKCGADPGQDFCFGRQRRISAFIPQNETKADGVKCKAFERDRFEAPRKQANRKADSSYECGRTLHCLLSREKTHSSRQRQQGPLPKPRANRGNRRAHSQTSLQISKKSCIFLTCDFYDYSART